MKKNTYLWRLLDVFRPFWGKFIVSWAIVAIVSLLAMVFPYSVGKIIDAAIGGDLNRVYFWILLGLVTSFLGKIVFFYLGQVYEIKNLDYDIENYLKMLSLGKCNQLSIGQHQNQNSGLKQNIIMKGSGSLQQLASMLINNLSFWFLQTFVGVVVIFFYDWVIASIVSLFIFLYFLISVYVYGKYQKRMDEMTNLGNESGKKYTDYIRNIVLLLFNSGEKSGMSNYSSSWQSYEGLSKKSWSKYVGSLRLGNTLEILAMGAVLFYCVHLFSLKKISPGEIAIYLFWVKMACGSIGNFNGVYRQFMRLSVDIKKFFAFVDIEPDIKLPPNPVVLQPFKGEVEFKDVSFRYPNHSYFEQFEANPGIIKTNDCCLPVLCDLNFKINRGEKVAFVGMSGAGKSTIISLLLRAYKPDSGSIFIDGVDYEKLDYLSLRHNIALVEQRIQMMDDTLKSNLLVGLNGRSDSISEVELVEAMELASMGKFFSALPNGLETRIGEGGIKLSGGEVQRLAIARAILKKASLIIFDEATSNLDSVNEDVIQKSISTLTSQATCIFIAHRLATVKSADRIIVLDHGRIIGSDTHKNLLLSCPAYLKMVKKQLAF